MNYEDKVAALVEHGGYTEDEARAMLEDMGDEDPAYVDYIVEQEITCRESITVGPRHDPYGVGCDLRQNHEGVHRVKDPFGPDTGTWTWSRRNNLTRVED